MPVIPDPASDEVLFRMLELILQHPSCIHVYMFEFKNAPKGMVHYLDSEWKKSWERDSKQEKLIELPKGEENIEKVLRLVKSIKNKDLPLVAEPNLEKYYNPYNIRLLVDWKDFTLLDIRADIKKTNRSLNIGYYPNARELGEDRFFDERKEHLGHLSPPFINLFQQFKTMFRNLGKNSYIILPEVSDRKERALILSELRKEPHNPQNFKKIDEFF